jgi:hypothetical protein
MWISGTQWEALTSVMRIPEWRKRKMIRSKLWENRGHFPKLMRDTNYIIQEVL